MTVRHHPIIVLKDGVGYNIPLDVKQHIIEDMKGNLELYLYFDFMDHKKRLSKVHKRLLALTWNPLYLNCVNQSKYIITKPPVGKWQEWYQQKQARLETQHRQKPREYKDPSLQVQNWTRKRFACMIKSHLNSTSCPLYREYKTLNISEVQRIKAYGSFDLFHKQYPLWSIDTWKLLNGLYFYRD